MHPLTPQQAAELEGLLDRAVGLIGTKGRRLSVGQALGQKAQALLRCSALRILSREDRADSTDYTGTLTASLLAALQAFPGVGDPNAASRWAEARGIAVPEGASPASRRLIAEDQGDWVANPYPGASVPGWAPPPLSWLYVQVSPSRCSAAPEWAEWLVLTAPAAPSPWSPRNFALPGEGWVVTLEAPTGSPVLGCRRVKHAAGYVLPGGAP